MVCGSAGGLVLWLPEPPAGTQICLGFDGADVGDWLAIRAETLDGLQFTPRYGPNGDPTIWNPANQPDSRISHSMVSDAVDELFDRFEVERMYCDPPRWATDIEQWARRHGEKSVLEWSTFRPRQMHEALERFISDLSTGAMTHDGCPLTAEHMANARMAARAQRYALEKPSDNQKIDACVASVMAHEAAADARASGWAEAGFGMTVWV